MTGAERTHFNAEIAPALAAQTGLGIAARWDGSGSDRFVYFSDRDVFLVVAGAQEGRYVDLAYALGLSYRGKRSLALVLPEGEEFATLQRAPWFRDEARPRVFVHDGRRLREQELPTRDETKRTLLNQAKDDPAKELASAATPAHLGEQSAAVRELVEWATTEPRLDAGHRRGERAWHCMGQKVLSIKSGHGGEVRITAGIHYTKPGEKPEPLPLAAGAVLSARDLADIQAKVQRGMEERLAGAPRIHRPDEHWLQAVIRMNPSLVGVEQPALRELPAWRPGGDQTSWGRGYIDLLGVDGHGDIRIVETKLSTNVDDLLIFQGLDYYIWAQVYRDALMARLGAPSRAEFEIHYVIGATADGAVHLSKHAKAQVSGLAADVRWRFQTLHGWYGARHPDVTPNLYPVGAVP